MKHRAQQILLLLSLIFISPMVTQAQDLGNAALLQLQQQIRTKLVKYTEDVQQFVLAATEQEAREKNTIRMMNYVLHPEVKMVQEFGGSQMAEVPFFTYLEQVRTKYKNQPQAFKMSLRESTLKYLPPKMQGDSVEIQIFYVEDLPQNQAFPIQMIIKAYLRKDKTAGPYFTGIRIAGTRRKEAPQEAKSFTLPSINTYQVYLDEQSLETVITRLAKELTNKLPSQVSSVQVSRLSFAGCQIYDKFSREFTVALANTLGQMRPNIQFTTEGNSAQSYEIGGQYDTRGDQFHILTNLFDPTGRSVATVTNSDLPLKWFDVNQTGFIPFDYQRIVKEQTLITQNMVNSAEDLKIELSTNKGRRGLLFKAGDPMEIYVQVNRPCKVRVIYQDATGKLLLVGDMNLREGQLNRAVMVADLVCTEPFGNEILLAYATVDQFANLTIKNERIVMDGQEFEQDVIKNTLAETVKIMKEEGTRGAGNRVSSDTPTFGSTQLQLQTVAR